MNNNYNLRKLKSITSIDLPQHTSKNKNQNQFIHAHLVLML